jgi:UDP-N-acetylmuramyl tripeptide synthase
VSSSNKKADYFYSINETNKDGCDFKLITNEKCMDLKVKFFQKHNVCNLVFAIACLDQLEKNIFFDRELIKSIDLPAGRAKLISKNNKNILVDYAHNFGGIKAIVNSVSTIYDDLIIVYGCGGERDSSEREKIMKFVCTNSRKVIFTSDNSRNESFQSILDDSRKDQEYSNLIVESDRKRAIKSGLEVIKEDEILLILGKGHEEFQEINGTKIPFNDQRVVEKML